MYRFLLTPRWLGINLFAALAIPLCILMGTWQLGRFEDRVDSHRKAADRPSSRSTNAVPLTAVLGEGKTERPMGGDDVGKPVFVTGRYDLDHQLIVPDRSLNGKRGYYVLTPFRTTSGRAIPVVRGWHVGDPPTGAGEDLPASPPDETTVRGGLQVAESTQSQSGHAHGGLPSGQLAVISASSLVNVLPYPVYNAWITLTKAAGGLLPVPTVKPEGSGLDMKAFQNLGYTGEWFVFAGFVVFMWFRLLRRDVEMAQDMALGLVPEPDPEGTESRTPSAYAEVSTAQPK